MKAISANLIFFGALKSYFGASSLMSIPSGTNLGNVLEKLKEQEPDAAEILSSCQTAVDSQLESKDFIILQSVEIAILPPFSGG